MPAQDRCRGDDQPYPTEPVDGQRPGKQSQPRPVRPCQPGKGPGPLAQGDSELMTQHQDLGVLPPILPARQPEWRHGTRYGKEDQLQAHKPKIICTSGRPETGSPGTGHGTALSRASAQVTHVFGTHRSSGARCANRREKDHGHRAAHRPDWPLQRQGHPKIVSNRFAETILGPRPERRSLCQPSGRSARARPTARPDWRGANLRLVVSAVTSRLVSALWPGGRMREGRH